MKDLFDKILVSFAKLFNKSVFSPSRERYPFRNKRKLAVRQLLRKKTSVKKSTKRKIVKKKKSSFKGVSSTKKKPAVRSPKKLSKVKKIASIKKKVIEKSKQKIKETPAPKLKYVGELTHYFSKIQVVVCKIKEGTLALGDQIKIQGKLTNFTQKVVSMQVESVDVKLARKGKIIGLKVEKEARPGDKVYKVL